MNSYILQYELRSGNTEAYTLNATLKRESEACKQLKANNLKRAIIYTIGYKDSTKNKPIKDFINALKENGIDVLVDIRANNDQKNMYGKEKLSVRLNRHRIKYIEKREYGVPDKVYRQYKSKKISSAEFEKLYRSEINDIKGLAQEIRALCEAQERGNAVLLCSENYAIENEYQDYSCHILANMLLETGEFKEIRHL
jgi:uncharacterized protein (DUF488 family)